LLSNSSELFVVVHIHCVFLHVDDFASAVAHLLKITATATPNLNAIKLQLPVLQNGNHDLLELDSVPPPHF
jgi:hypothetical protein